MKESVIDTK